MVAELRGPELHTNTSNRLAGKRIIVTGGASGLGAALVRSYVAEGAYVVSFYRRQSGDALLKSLHPDFAERVHFVACDVSQKDQVDAATAAAVDRMGGLDVLVNSAGIAPNPPGPAEHIELSTWEEVFAVNARGTFLTNVAAFPHMRDRGGRILNIASGAGVFGFEGKAHYSASKGAVIAWTRCVAKEWAKYRITVNAILPCIITPLALQTRSCFSPDALKAHHEYLRRTIPLGGDLGDAERDFVPYMVFLAGDGASFVTGQMISIDGGMTMVR
jgi:NAD(P)-dependent dehydrogenase (short-subunit alcohol dehydrogenase family)